MVVVPTLKFNNGRTIPVLGMGTWPGSPDKVNEYDKQAILDAIDLGYRHIDCAHFYQNEKVIGEAIEQKIKEGVVKREELFITSKLWNNCHRPEVVEPSLMTTLKNLKLEYLDLYLVHWPHSFKEGDDLLPLDDKGNFIDGHIDYVDTWKAMEEVAKKGLTKSIGISNFNSQQIERLLKTATIVPVTNQVECHPFLNQKKLHDFCGQRGITITSYCPLGAPHITRAGGKTGLLDDPKIKAIADKHKKTPAQVCIRYNIQLGNIVIPKSASKKRLAENIDVFDFTLSPEDMKAIDSLNRNERIVKEEPAKLLDHYPFNIEY